MKKFLRVLLAAAGGVVFAVLFAAVGFAVFYTPSLTADMSSPTGAVTTGASGYLYGVAEKGIPSKNMTESVDISSASVKVPGGLQHPVGDIDHIYGQLDNTDYNVVYLQDAYSTWYYEQGRIEELRSKGEYDWKSFVEDDYLPKVEEAVKYISQSPYSDKTVYCIYNECDNGVWFGETKNDSDREYGVYGDYNDAGAQNFFEAWKMTYDFVKSINSDALIGGPGFCDYDSKEIEAFMTYCADNACVPDVMIYHELNDSSVYHWQSHVKKYRALEKTLNIDKLPIIVTEYGRMQDNGIPGKMLQYITQIETSKVYADNAFWRLANNLCDVAADDNSPNSNWWLYRWYTDMEGQTVDIKYQDLFKSNLGKAIKGEADFSSQGFMGLVTIDEDENVLDSKIDIICGGRDGSAVVNLKNLNRTVFNGQRVRVTIEEVLYKGISGIVNSSTVKSIYYADITDKTFKIDMNNMDESSAYHITIVPFPENSGTVQEDYTNNDFVKRYEFEDGNLLGDAYTYDSWYATTGDKEGLVGGIEKEGDGVKLTFEVPENGSYDLNIIYGNSNDGAYDENGRQNPDDRTYSIASVEIDGKSEELAFENTIKSEYTDCQTLIYYLEKGEHTITIKHNAGTIVLDSLLVTKTQQQEQIAVLDDADRTTDSVQSYLVVAPNDGYYTINHSENTEAYINENGISISEDGTSVYLMRGLNYIDVSSSNRNGLFVETTEKTGKVIILNPDDASLSGTAKLETFSDRVMNIAKNGDFTLQAPNKHYIDGITCNSGKASYTVRADKAGSYALTIIYANNDEGGKHDYNVDLIERYVTVAANGEAQDVYCRNTYSWDTYKTVTCYINLKAGENTIELTNSGNNRFDNQDTAAPLISVLTVNEISA